MAGEAAADGTPFGRYRLVELLGRGGMGEVWRAHDSETDRIVAIKVLPANLSEDEDFKRRFRREAHAAARLNSPHVIPIHHYGEIDGRLYVDMRLVEGRDLAAVLADGPLDPARAVRIIEQVAKALHAAHDVGLLHRDIKPSNVLLDRDDFAYLIDFGIARALNDTRMTKTGNTIGTFAYIAPERLGTGAEDARADIYSLACVFYECLTGHPPFPGDTMGPLINAHLNTPPPRPSINQPNVPPAVDEVIATGMAKDPDQRYATTIELADAARDAITAPIQQLAPPPATEQAQQQSAEPTQPATRQRPPPPETATPPAPLAHRRRQALIAAAVVVLAVAGVTGYVLLQSRPPVSQTSTAQPSTTSHPVPPVAEAALEARLLSAEDIGAAMHTAGMTVASTFSTLPGIAGGSVSDPACLPLAGAAIADAYAGSGWSTGRGQTVKDPGNGHKVYQFVVLFPSAQNADAFFTTSARRWMGCSNRQMTVTVAGVSTAENVGPVSNTNGILSATVHTPAGSGSGAYINCLRALAAANNVAIDVQACFINQADYPSDSAVSIAHQIAAKVPTT